MTTNKTNRTALRLAVAALAVLLLCGAAFAGAAGAASIDIGSAEEWNAFAASVNAGDTTKRSTDINITKSFSFKDKSVTRLGTNSSKYYMGNFEGNGFTISDFVIDSGSSANAGLLGYYKGSSIKNLTISNFSVTGYSSVGGLVGYAYSASSFENVRAQFGNVLINGSSDVGGLVGSTESAISFANCSVASCCISGGTYAGGLVGYALPTSSFADCDVADCSMSGYAHIGGLAGQPVSKSSTPWMDGCTVTNCILSSESNNVGGLVGNVYSANQIRITGCTVESCTAASTTADGVGGLVGYAHYTYQLKFNAENVLNNVAIRGKEPERNSNISGIPAVSTNVNVTQIQPIWVNNNKNAKSPKVYIAKSTTNPGPEKQDNFNKDPATSKYITVDSVPAGAWPVTILDGYGFMGQYKAFGYVFDDDHPYVPPVPTYTISVTPTANGTVEADKTSVKAGDTVNITAEPNAGQRFVSWSVTMTSGGTPVAVDDPTDPETSFTMPAGAVTITAVFEEVVAYPVSVTPTVNGTVEADTDSAEEGETVSITAEPNEGQFFVCWNVRMTSSSAPVTVDNPADPETTFTMPAGAVTVTAEFSKEANLVGFTIDTENLSNVWPSSDPKLYWTTEDSAIKIPIGVKKISGGKYLFAYNLTFAGNMTNAADGIRTFSSNWTTIPVVDNGWNVAITANALSEDRVNITGNLSILDIGIPENTFTEGYYNLSIPYGELGVTSTTDITSPGLIELSTGDSVYFPSGDKKFIFYVRNATEDVPNTTAYEPYDAPDNYPTLASGNPGETFYYFTERLDGQEKRVYLTAVTDPAYDNLFDTNNWTISDITGVSMFNGSIADSVTADSDGKLKNSVVVNGTALGTAKITLTLNKGKGVLENITCFTFSAEPWKKSFVTNDNPVRAAGYAKDTLNWSFATPLIYNYTVSAGPVTTTGNGWNTHVKFGNETYGNATSGTAVPVVWNGMVSYNVSDSEFALKNETGVIQSSTNFTVITNTIADGTKRVLVTLTGYKLGDANIDGNVNIADSAIVGITILKGDSAAEAITFLPYENRLYADCDASRSGSIDVADILAINRFIVGLDPWKAA